MILREGTMVEVLRSRALSQVMVVTKTADVPLRAATYWERFRFWWRAKRQTSTDIGAAIEAGHAIEKAKKP